LGTNIVITRRTDFHPNGIIIAHDLEEAVRQAELHDGQLHRKGEAFIIGGAEIFQQALSRHHRFIRVHTQVQTKRPFRLGVAKITVKVECFLWATVITCCFHTQGRAG
jgi:dihydrofolate reductase